jgi:hypothetical protein
VDEIDPNACLPRQLNPNAITGILLCSVLEVRPGPAQICDSARGRFTPTPAFREAALQRLRQLQVCDAPGLPNCPSVQVCGLRAANEVCHIAAEPTGEVGWCYVDPFVIPTDDPALVATCPATERRRIRFVDPESQTPAPDATVLLACW